MRTEKIFLRKIRRNRKIRRLGRAVVLSEKPAEGLKDGQAGMPAPSSFIAWAKLRARLYGEVHVGSRDHVNCSQPPGQEGVRPEKRLTYVKRVWAFGFKLLSGSEGIKTPRGEGGSAVASVATMELTLYTRAGCHLCEEAKAQLEPLLREFGLALREVDVDTDPELVVRFGQELPVIFLDGRKVAKYRLNVEQFRRLLERSRK